MTKRHYFTALVAMLCCSALFAQLESGKVYRIESVAAPGKSLMTQNSSLDTGSDVVLWTETDVASQCWTPATSSTTILRNAYSNAPMSATSSTAGAKIKQSRSGSGRWLIEAVDETRGIYKIKISTQDLFITLENTSNGSVPVLAEGNDDTKQLWRFVETEAKTTFTSAMREEMMDAYISSAVEAKGDNRKTFIGGSWGESEQLEVVLDAYETTGREDYLTLAREIYNWFNANVGNTWTKLVYTDNYKWYGHDFNDDVMWQVLATARLGLLSNNHSFINIAKRNFDAVYKRAFIPFTGLMRWAQNSGDPYGTNSCINGPAEVAACYLGFAGYGEEYFEKARDLYAAQRYVLANQMTTGKVWDSVVWNPETQKVKSRNEWGSTYNQGTMLGAACMLYKYYGDEQYLEDAKKIMEWTVKNLCDSHGIINVCQGGDNHDLWGFKGILMRYVRRFIRDCGATDYQGWMEKNALHAYCNRTPEGITPTAWLQKGNAENTSDDFGNSTAASAAVNVIFPDDPALPYEEKAKEPEEPEPDPIAVNEASRLSWSGVYVGGHIRRERPSTITKLKESGFTYVLLFNVHVNPDGTLLTDGETICEDGEYVFDRTQPNYISDINALKASDSAIKRIEIVIGGWGNDSYNNIKAILDANSGSLAKTALYRNFRALKEALPIIDGVNNDDEQCYDVATAVRFHEMMYDLGFRTSVAPYTNKSFWQSLVTQLNEAKPGACDRVLIQCYDGGASNNPANWHIGDIPLLAGRTNYQTDMETSLAQMQTWRDNANVVGGFVWVYNDETWNLKNWATGMNQIFATPPTTDDGLPLEGVATLYLGLDYTDYGFTLPVGRYTADELTAYGFPINNSVYNSRIIRSVKLVPGYQLTAFRSKDLTGTSYTFTESTEEIPTALHTRIVSIEVSQIPDGIGDFQKRAESQAVYDLSGRSVSHPSSLSTQHHKGVYIIRQGNQTRKIIH